jgi:ABC-type glycerol-3-phosphate transport system substrate-binding protein
MEKGGISVSTEQKENPAGLGHKLGRREFLRLAGIGSAAALVSACAPKVVEVEKSVEVTKIVEQAVEVEVEKVVTPTPPPPAPKRNVLRLQSSYPVDYPNTLVMAENVFAEFKDSHPDFEVEVNFVRVPDVATSFIQGLEVDAAPDFFYCFESQGTLGYLDHLYDTTDLIKEAGLWDDFYQSAKDLWTLKGKLVGVPTYFGVKCYVYRADIWDEAGLDPDNFPTTWEEFQEAAIKLTVPGERDGYSAFEDGQVGFEYLLQHVHQNGGTEYESDDPLSPAAINSPEALEAFTWFVDLVRKYGIMSKEGDAAPEGSEPVLDGYSGMQTQAPWWVPIRHRRFPELFDQDLIRVGSPLTRKAQVGHLDASGWAVNAHSDILEEVLDFVKIFLKDEHYMHYHDSVSADGETIYTFPCSRRSINQDPGFWIAEEPLVQETYLPAFEMGMSTARTHVGFIEVREYVYPRMDEQALYEVKPDQAVLDEAAAQMDAITERTAKELQ